LENDDSDGIRALVRRVTDDLSSLAKEHVELARADLTRGMKHAAADSGALVLGAMVALIGFAMLCVSVVAALRPAIPALWLRLLLMAGVYLVVGALVVFAFSRKIRGDVELKRTRTSVQRTQLALREQVRHGPT
jgi:hypothetical protein